MAEIQKSIAPLRTANIGKALELRASGMIYSEIAKIIGTTKSTIYKWINLPLYN
jgi:transposase